MRDIYTIPFLKRAFLWILFGKKEMCTTNAVR